MRRSPQVFRSAAVLATLVAFAACSEALSSVDQSAATPPAKVDQLATAISARFTTPERSGRFESARRRLVSGALNPSSVYNDTTIWTVSSSNPTRTLTALGSLTGKGYRFEVAPIRGPLLRPGDTRHTMMLRRIGDDEYRWNTGVDFAAGPIRAADIAAMLQTLLTAGHQRDPAMLQLASKSAFPRSAAVLAKLFSVDSLSLRPGPQGTTLVHLVLGVHPDRLRRTAPHFAAYVEKYVSRSQFRFTLADRSGAMFMDFTGGERRVVVRYRVNDKDVVSYLGPARALPDSLRLTSDLAMRVKVFDVGWRNLVTDFTMSRTERSRSWMIVARQEPEWRLPLVTARLIRTPLRRPFQGVGAHLEVAVMDSAGGQTLIARRTHLEVRESAILRFLSGLVSRVFDDLDVNVEREEAAYVRELMTAFQADARHILGRGD